MVVGYARETKMSTCEVTLFHRELNGKNISVILKKNNAEVGVSRGKSYSRGDSLAEDMPKRRLA
jgi:hypothetical protein